MPPHKVDAYLHNYPSFSTFSSKLNVWRHLFKVFNFCTLQIFPCPCCQLGPFEICTMLADDDIQMTPRPYVWLKFVFCPFSTHEWILVLLLGKKLDQPIHHFTFSCNKQISIEKSSFNKYIIDTHWTKLNVTSFSFKSFHPEFSICNYDLL
jgi:hypothetical protein